MNIKPEELELNGYVLLESLNHKELIPFVQKYIRIKTRFSSFYWIANIFFAGLIAGLLYAHINNNTFNLSEGITHLSFGFAIAFLLIPMHEYIHVLAYRFRGATSTSYDANLKKFYFMAIADAFVADKNDFLVVAMAPSVVITSICILLLFFLSPLWSVTSAGVLLTHTAFSSGDFALMSYFDFHRNKEVVTYDDKSNGISYFYGKCQ
ncbi:MAG: DUF3267 domain-containing protein [Ignavibacteriales bacterium]|nr:DUF3267 domain-containing protein [Ignavibacteriales bacterium]MCF8314548.1 DUF3267 domain-containing protein [Ignavibacteriales bacterium]MCF8436415.1 DUF3267 domain-containing protein [Ignavibacteriales bacterium]